MALLSPSATVTNSITQMLIFYVLFFAPLRCFRRSSFPSSCSGLGSSAHLRCGCHPRHDDRP